MPLTLIGVQHGIAENGRLLEAILKELEPDIIFHEGSLDGIQQDRDALRYFEQAMKRGSWGPNTQKWMMEVERLKYEEHEVPLAYALATGTPYVELEPGNVLWEPARLKAIQEGFVRNRVGVTLADMKDGFKKRQMEFRAYSRELMNAVENGREEEYVVGHKAYHDPALGLGPRDRRMSEVIRLYNRAQRPVAIVGPLHLLRSPDNKTLYDLMQDWNPARRFALPKLSDPPHPLGL